MQQIIKKDKSLPAILNGVRQAVANAENQPKTKREVRNEELARKREAAQCLVNSGMKAEDVAKAIGMSRQFVYNHTTANESFTLARLEKARAKSRVVKRVAFEARKAYYIPIMLELRKLGYTNAEIAEKTGFSGWTVLSYVGVQPDELTLMSMRVAGAKRRLRNKAVANNIAREQKEQQRNIVPIAGD